MAFSSCRKQLFLLFLGTFLALQPCLYAHNPGQATPITPQRNWSNALGTAVNAALYFGPPAYSVYQEAKQLSPTCQKERIGDKKVSEQTYNALQEIVEEMGIKEIPEIIAMQDSRLCPNPNARSIEDSITIINSRKKDFLGVHATNAYIFIDEDVINFEEHPLRSTFLVKRELARYKNNHFSKIIIGNVALTMAQAVALYKTFPLVTQGCNNIIHKLGWTSLNDPRQNGLFLGISRFTLNYLICPFVTQLIIEKIRNSAHAWYQQQITPKLEDSFVPREYTLKLLVELIKFIPSYEIRSEETNEYYPGRKLLYETLYEVCLMALNRYHSSQIIDKINTFRNHKDFKNYTGSLDTLKSFIEQNNRRVSF